MTHFEFLAVALSFVLGLAVTVLLTSLLRSPVISGFSVKWPQILL